MLAPFEGLIETSEGPTFVRIAGKGPRLVVFHAGPGFDHEPLLSGLEPLLSRRTLVFFDQLGCGRTPARQATVTADATFAHAAAVLDALAPEPFGIAAFSWGALVAAAALDRRPELTATQSLLISPMPFDGAGYAKARAAITERIPPEVLQRLGEMIAAGAEGADAFATLQDYYVATPPAQLPPMQVTTPVYLSVDATLGETFDFSAAVQRFGDISIIRGRHEYSDEKLLKPAIDLATHFLILDKVGHYPFFEGPEGFSAAIDSVFATRED